MKITTSIFTTLAICTVVVSSTHVAQAQSRTAATATKAPATRSWVQLKAATDKTVYAPGETVKVRLTATNTHTRGAYLRFTSGQRYDLKVVNTITNEHVYTWSATRMFMQALGSLWLRPGQSQLYQPEIGDEMGELKPGKYRLLAHLTNTPNPIHAAPVEFQVSEPAVKVTARTDKTTYAAGEPVKIIVTTTNRSNRASTLKFNSGQMFDVFITDAANRPVWNYAANLRFIQVLGSQTWKANETKGFSATWNGIPLPDAFGNTSIKPGRYKVQAVLWSTPQVKAPPIWINIV